MLSKKKWVLKWPPNKRRIIIFYIIVGNWFIPPECTNHCYPIPPDKCKTNDCQMDTTRELYAHITQTDPKITHLFTTKETFEDH